MHPEQEFYLGLSRGNNTDSQSVAVGGRGGRPEGETTRSDEEEEEGETGPSSARADSASVATNASLVAKSGNFLSIAAISAIARNCTTYT